MVAYVSSTMKFEI